MGACKLEEEEGKTRKPWEKTDDDSFLGGEVERKNQKYDNQGKRNFFSSFRENAHFPDQLSLLISRISDFFFCARPFVVSAGGRGGGGSGEEDVYLSFVVSVPPF